MANILLAEDDASTRRFLTSALQKAGHSITACADGLEALTVLEEKGGTFQLLLTDIVMPGIDGIELSSRAGALFPALKVMFITGFAAMALGKAEGAQGHMRIVSKPFHLGALTSEIEEMLKN